MKIAISLPDELFREIDAGARSLKLSRSALLAAAAREFLARHLAHPNPTQAWNDAIDASGPPGSDPAARAFRKRSKTVLRERARW